MEDKKMTPEEWEASVKESVVNYVDAFLKMSKSCNMGTLYYHPVKEEYETHTELDQGKIAGVELRIVFDFDEIFDKDKITFI
jgi:hypothetical protein